MPMFIFATPTSGGKTTLSGRLRKVFAKRGSGVYFSGRAVAYATNSLAMRLIFLKLVARHATYFFSFLSYFMVNDLYH